MKNSIRNHIGLMATPAEACVQNTKPRVKVDPTHPRAEQTAARDLAEHIDAAKGPDGLARLVAALPRVVDRAMQTTLPHKYSPELAEAIAAQVIANLTGVTSTPCPVYRDCADTNPGHFDHFTHDIKVLDDSDGSTILDAGMVANSGSDRHVIVYLRNAEFTDPAKVREKTAEVRAFLDRVDELADRVFADHQARAEQAGGDR